MPPNRLALGVRPVPEPVWPAHGPDLASPQGLTPIGVLPDGFGTRGACLQGLFRVGVHRTGYPRATWRRTDSRRAVWCPKPCRLAASRHTDSRRAVWCPKPCRLAASRHTDSRRAVSHRRGSLRGSRWSPAASRVAWSRTGSFPVASLRRDWPRAAWRPVGWLPVAPRRALLRADAGLRDAIGVRRPRCYRGLESPGPQPELSIPIRYLLTPVRRSCGQPIYRSPALSPPCMPLAAALAPLKRLFKDRFPPMNCVALLFGLPSMSALPVGLPR